MWDWLMNGSSSAKKVIDGAYNGVDMIVYTDEEKAIAAQKKQEFYVKLLKAYEPFKIAQRMLALLYSFPYVLIVVYAVIVSDIVLLKAINEALGFQTLLILGFYFSGGAFEGVIRAKGEATTAEAEVLNKRGAS